MREIPLDTHPLDFDPPPATVTARALLRYQRLLEAQAQGQDIPAEELAQARERVYGKIEQLEGSNE